MSDSRKDDEFIYELSPKFNILYELFMPTGRKIKSTLLVIIAIVILDIYLLFGAKGMNIGNFIAFGNMTILGMLKIMCFTLTLVLILKLVIHIVVQSMQYKHITYRFYNTYMVYEDDFLNQHRKNIEYSNVKEVEIRRTIMDRILGFGVIIIYTNAENSRSNGLVIYGLKNPRESYDIIDDIIHKNKSNVEIKESTENAETVEDKEESIVSKIEEDKKKDSEVSQEQYSSEEEIKKRVEQNKKDEEEFLDSLKNINSDNEN